MCVLCCVVGWIVTQRPLFEDSVTVSLSRGSRHSAASGHMSRSPWVSYLLHPDRSKRSTSRLPWDVPTWQQRCSPLCVRRWIIVRSLFSPSVQKTYTGFSCSGHFSCFWSLSAELPSQLRSLSAVIYLTHNLPSIPLFLALSLSLFISLSFIIPLFVQHRALPHHSASLVSSSALIVTFSSHLSLSALPSCQEYV